MHGTLDPPVSTPALRRLLADLAAGADVLLLTDAAESNAILDEAAADLAGMRIRPIRVRAGTPGGLGLAAFLAQVAPSGAAPSGAAPGADPAGDAALQRSIRNLTVPDAGCDRIALLVSEADGLQPAALRVVQLACRGSAHLQFVLAGGPGLLEYLEDPEFSLLASRLERTPLGAAAAFIPAPGLLGAKTIRPAALSRPLPRSAAVGTAAALGATVLILCGIAIGRFHGPSAPPPASLAAAAPSTPAAEPPTPAAGPQAPAQDPAGSHQLAAQAPAHPAPALQSVPPAPTPPSRLALPTLTPATAAPPPPAAPPVQLAAPLVPAPVPPTVAETDQPAPAQPDLPALAPPAPVPTPTEAAATRPPAAPPTRDASRLAAVSPLPAPPIPPATLDGPAPRDPARPARSRRRYARSHRSSEWTDTEGRPVPPPLLAPGPEDTPRDPAFGVNQFEQPYQGHPYIGTFTTDAHGARVFRYGQ